MDKNGKAIHVQFCSQRNSVAAWSQALHFPSIVRLHPCDPKATMWFQCAPLFPAQQILSQEIYFLR